jgi:hypothetical protein
MSPEDIYYTRRAQGRRAIVRDVHGLLGALQAKLVSHRVDGGVIWAESSLVFIIITHLPECSCSY